MKENNKRERERERGEIERGKKEFRESQKGTDRK